MSQGTPSVCSWDPRGKEKRCTSLNLHGEVGMPRKMEKKAVRIDCCWRGLLVDQKLGWKSITLYTSDNGLSRPHPNSGINVDCDFLHVKLSTYVFPSTMVVMKEAGNICYAFPLHPSSAHPQKIFYTTHE